MGVRAMDRAGAGPGGTTTGESAAGQAGVYALFQQRVAGDDALLKLTGLRFAQMGAAAEVYADNLADPDGTALNMPQ